MRTSQNKKILKLVELALLFALVIVLQMIGTFIKIGPLPMSLVLVPIVIGAFLLGWKEGAFLGLSFGVVTMIMGITGMDGFSHILWQLHPFWFVVICLLKAFAAGLGSGLIYKGLNKLLGEKRVVATTVIASISAPIINTGIFVVGMLLFYFGDVGTIQAGVAEMMGEELIAVTPALEYIFLGLAGLNFVGEFIVNLVVSPAIVRIVSVVSKKLYK
jgi:uncharacterized membrane protein